MICQLGMEVLPGLRLQFFGPRLAQWRYEHVLLLCSNPLTEENDGGENMQSEEWLAKVAALGRASAALSLPRLADRLGAALAALQQCIQSGGLAA